MLESKMPYYFCVALLDTWQASVIKGNAGELAALAGTTEVNKFLDHR